MARNVRGPPRPAPSAKPGAVAMDRKVLDYQPPEPPRGRDPGRLAVVLGLATTAAVVGVEVLTCSGLFGPFNGVPAQVVRGIVFLSFPVAWLIGVGAVASAVIKGTASRFVPL